VGAEAVLDLAGKEVQVVRYVDAAHDADRAVGVGREDEYVLALFEADVDLSTGIVSDGAAVVVIHSQSDTHTGLLSVLECHGFLDLAVETLGDETHAVMATGEVANQI
jgi:hypothetical protein